MDPPPGSQIYFYPEDSLTDIIQRFFEATSPENVLQVSDEEFPRVFEKIYAEEMDWRIERGGPTEAEIRRIADRDGEECTPEKIALVQQMWRSAINEFFSERALRRYRKQAELSRSEWELLEEEAVVIHEKMQAEELLAAIDEDYDPGCEQNLDEEEREDPDFARWLEQLTKIREQLKQSPPQLVFRSLVDELDNHQKWELKGGVEHPLAAEIWLRPDVDDKYDEDDDEYDEDDD